jgi:hypothetical protein
MILIALASDPESTYLPLYLDRCQAGFPSPALFPCESCCQSQLPNRNPFVLSWLESRREYNQPLATLTIVRALKALNSNGGVVSIYGRARSPVCSLAPFVA